MADTTAATIVVLAPGSFANSDNNPSGTQPFTYTADCVIVEEHDDRLQMTQHPVEFGSVIADHAYLLPQRLTLRYGWADSGDSQTDIQNMYANVLAAQQNRALCKVFTFRRNYDNMLIESVRVRTDVETVNVLDVDIDMVQMLLSSSQTITLAQATQASATDTAATASNGTRAATAIPQAPDVTKLPIPTLPSVTSTTIGGQSVTLTTIFPSLSSTGLMNIAPSVGSTMTSVVDAVSSFGTGAGDLIKSMEPGVGAITAAVGGATQLAGLAKSLAQRPPSLLALLPAIPFIAGADLLAPFRSLGFTSSLVAATIGSDAAPAADSVSRQNAGVFNAPASGDVVTRIKQAITTGGI